MPSFKDRRYLMQNKFFEKIILNLTSAEGLLFEAANRQGNKLKNELQRNSAKAFPFSKAYSRKLSQIKQIKDSIGPEEDDLDDLQKNRIISVSGRLNPGELDTRIEAYPLIFGGGNDYILLPKNSTAIIFNSNSKHFEQKRVMEIQENDKILIFAESGREYLDSVAGKIDDKYYAKRQLADIWRQKLMEYTNRVGYTGTVLASVLKTKASIQRTPATLNNWLHDDTTIAPDNYKTVLPSLAQFLNGLGCGFQHSECLEAIEYVYKGRREAGAKIINALVTENVNEPKNDDTLTLRINQASVNLVCKVIESRLSKIETFYSQLWQIKKIKDVN